MLKSFARNEGNLPSVETSKMNLNLATASGSNNGRTRLLALREPAQRTQLLQYPVRFHKVKHSPLEATCTKLQPLSRYDIPKNDARRTDASDLTLEKVSCPAVFSYSKIQNQFLKSATDYLPQNRPISGRLAKTDTEKCEGLSLLRPKSYRTTASGADNLPIQRPAPLLSRHREKGLPLIRAKPPKYSSTTSRTCKMDALTHNSSLPETTCKAEFNPHPYDDFAPKDLYKQGNNNIVWHPVFATPTSDQATNMKVGYDKKKKKKKRRRIRKRRKRKRIKSVFSDSISLSIGSRCKRGHQQRKQDLLNILTSKCLNQESTAFSVPKKKASKRKRTSLSTLASRTIETQPRRLSFQCERLAKYQLYNKCCVSTPGNARGRRGRGGKSRRLRKLRICGIAITAPETDASTSQQVDSLESFSFPAFTDLSGFS